MAITIDAISGSGAKSNVSSFTWNHTCAANTILVVTASGYDAAGGTSVSGVTYNGVALTKQLDSLTNSNQITTSIWKLNTPATGTHAIVVTFSASGYDWTSGGAVSFFGGLGTTGNTGTYFLSGTPSITVTTTTGSLVVDSIFNAQQPITCGQTQIQQANINSDSSASSYKIATTNSTVMSWTGAAQCAQTAVEFLATRTGGSLLWLM